MEDLLGTMQERHSTRAPFDPRKQVPKEDVRRILEAGRWAPTPHNMQNFEIIVIDDKKVLRQVGSITTYPSPDFIRENFAQLSASEEELSRKKVGILGMGFPPAWREKAKLETAIKEETNGTLDETIKGSPAVLIVLHDARRRAPASEGDELGTLGLGCMMENMWLMAERLGVGFQIMSVFSDDSVQKDLKKLLNIPDHMAVSFAVRLGYPTRQYRYLRVRRDVASFAYGNRYGEEL
jgi:nitroreductase